MSKQTSQEVLAADGIEKQTLLEQQISQLQVQAKEVLSRQEAQMQKLKMHYEGEINSLRETNRKLEEELHASTLTSHSADDKVVSLTKRCEVLRRKMNEDSKAQMEQRNTLHGLEYMLDNKTSEVSSLIQKCHILETEAKNSSTKMSELQNKLSAEIQQKNTIQNELLEIKFC